MRSGVYHHSAHASSRHSERAVPRRMKANILSLVILLAALLFLGPRYLHQPWTSLRVAGAVISLSSLGLILVARFQLGRAFSIRAKATRLVTTGLYARIRNPIYIAGCFFFPRTGDVHPRVVASVSADHRHPHADHPCAQGSDHPRGHIWRGIPTLPRANLVLRAVPKQITRRIDVNCFAICRLSRPTQIPLRLANPLMISCL